MKNKLLLILWLMGAFPLCASAPSKQEIMQKAREQASQQEEQEQKPAIVQEEQKEREAKKAEQEDECAICLQKLHVEGIPTKTLHCGAQSRNPKAGEHTFHTACINEWLARNPRCPLCKTIVPQNEIPQILVPDAQAEEQQELEDLLSQANQVDDIALQREAQLELGDIYRIGGNGIARDFAKAVDFYNQAKQADDPVVQRYAQLGLGIIYRTGGDGIARDFVQAVHFYNLANNLDAPIRVQREAQLTLGHIYRLGAGSIARNFVQAVHFYNQANNPGDIAAQRAAQLWLGTIYSIGGYGIARDIAQAVRLLNQANKPDASITVQREAQLQLEQINQK